MFRRVVLPAVLALLTVGVAGCGSSTSRVSPSVRPSLAATPSPSTTPDVIPTAPPTEAPTPSPAPIATRAEVIALAEKTFPKSMDAGQVFYIDCSAGGTTLPKCPFTKRLIARLQSIQVPPCRCQNFFPERRVTTEITPTGAIAHVNFGVSRIDLIVIRSNDRPLVDDERCGGRGPSTSIYANAGPC